MSIFGGNGAAPKAVIDAARKIMTGEEIEEKKKLDPVGQEDGDIDNDGDEDKSDKYLANRRKTIKKAMQGEETIHEAELPDLPQRKSMTAKDYTAQANRHHDLADYHKKEAERHVHTPAVNLHKKAAQAHTNAADAADEAAENPTTKTAIDDYAKARSSAKARSEVARERGAEADKRRAHVRKVDGKDVDESVDVDAGNVEKALKHDCATHVHHEEYGVGRCIPGMHTLEQVDEENGVVTHYDVMFENDEGSYIVENVPVAEMKVLKDMNHGHKKKKSMGENYAGNYGSSVASYNKEKDHEKRYEKENPGKKWKDLSWGHQQSHSDEYDKNPK